MIDYSKITDNALIIHLLKKIDMIEEDLRKLDPNILIEVELYKIALPDEENHDLPIGGACDINNL